MLPKLSDATRVGSNKWIQIEDIDGLSMNWKDLKKEAMKDDYRTTKWFRALPPDQVSLLEELIDA